MLSFDGARTLNTSSRASSASSRIAGSKRLRHRINSLGGAGMEMIVEDAMIHHKSGAFLRLEEKRDPVVSRWLLSFPCAARREGRPERVFCRRHETPRWACV